MLAAIIAIIVSILAIAGLIIFVFFAGACAYMTCSLIGTLAKVWAGEFSILRKASVAVITLPLIAIFASFTYYVTFDVLGWTYIKFVG